MKFSLDQDWNFTNILASKATSTSAQYVNDVFLFHDQDCLEVFYIRTFNIADVDDLFVRKDLLHRYNVDREMAEEFKKIFSFDPLDSEEHDGYKV